MTVDGDGDSNAIAVDAIEQWATTRLRVVVGAANQLVEVVTDDEVAVQALT